MKKSTLVTLAAVVGMASIGCSTTANTNANLRANVATANSNTAVVVNTNTANTNGTGVSTMGNRNTMSNAELTRADYDRDKDRYASEAKSAGRTIGSGAEDGWLWTKTRAAMLATDDLRESTINVDVSNNVVTLTGTVASKAQSDRATAVAKGIDGVTNVRNMLKVSAGDSMTNQMTDGDRRPANSNR
ncbi:MAG TPA: BON domain-containing protein [Pyrinomonadaceae bacterium]|nr:BON domain-containing protein [Pyrinomonadaceae bacterium]